MRSEAITMWKRNRPENFRGWKQKVNNKSKKQAWHVNMASDEWEMLNRSKLRPFKQKVKYSGKWESTQPLSGPKV